MYSYKAYRDNCKYFQSALLKNSCFYRILNSLSTMHWLISHMAAMFGGDSSDSDLEPVVSRVKTVSAAIPDLTESYEYLVRLLCTHRNVHMFRMRIHAFLRVFILLCVACLSSIMDMRVARVQLPPTASMFWTSCESCSQICKLKLLAVSSSSGSEVSAANVSSILFQSVVTAKDCVIDLVLS